MAFDYASDGQIANLTAGQGLARSGASRYRVVLVPPCRYLPEATAQALLRLARQGIRVVFADALPNRVPGFHESARRTAELGRTGQQLRALPTVRVSPDVIGQLDRFGVRRERWVADGLSCIRKRRGGEPAGDTTEYFVANLSDRFREGWISLSATGRATVYDPLTSTVTGLPQRKNASGGLDVYLRLEPGESCFLTVAPGAGRPQPGRGKPVQPGTVLTLTGPYQFRFVSGRPALTSEHPLAQLREWTGLSDSAAYFSGCGRYSHVFDLPAGADPTADWTLDLGEVREVADVWLNGRPLGTAWCLPYRLRIPAGQLRRQGNRIDIDVTNLSANYLRLHDRLQPGWKKFYDINIVDIRYRPFDASRWAPVPSGLLGPVHIRREN